MELTIQIIGIFGAFLTLVGFALLKLRKIKSEDFIYNLLNLFGSAFLMASAIYTRSYPFIILNIVWIVFSLLDLIKKK